MKTICVMRDLYKALAKFENNFEAIYGVSLNEAMILCSLCEAQKELSSSELAQQTEMTPSHTSKVIGFTEEKGLIERNLGKVDKRQMLFKLTPKGAKLAQEFALDKVEIPDLIKPLFS
ncbi:MAG: MarR family winged helix-turn-helix transcriptional regulator [Bacteroides sp.]